MIYDYWIMDMDMDLDLINHHTIQYNHTDTGYESYDQSHIQSSYRTIDQKS